jgi:glycosyltransferase involved in cell wall biosynthesis
MSSSRSSKNTALRKHIVFINYYFPPTGGGGVQRLTKFLKYFDYEKYYVTVLTVKPSFFYTSDESLLKDIPGQVRVLRSESLDPFRLICFYRVLKNKLVRKRDSSRTSDKDSRTSAQTHPESTNLIRRISMSFFVPDSRILWLPFALVKLWQLHRINQVDLIVASMPPFTSGIIGSLFQRWMKVPVVLEFRDAWTKNPYLPQMGSLYSSLNEKLEKFCLTKATGVIFVNPKLREYYETKHSFLVSKALTTIRNGFDSEDFGAASLSHSADRSQPFTLGIMGTIYSQGNRPVTLLKAVDELLKDDPGLKSKIKLTFLGKWSSDFLKLLGQFEIRGNTELISYLPHQQALKKAAEFDALSLSIESNFPGSELVTPGRIYEYLRLHRPILALCPMNSDLAFLVREHNAGEAVEFERIDEIKSILKSWIENRSSLSQKYKFEKLDELDRFQLSKALLDFLQIFQ